MSVSRSEVSATILRPYFDAVRDVFAAYPTHDLTRVLRVRFIVDPAIHDTPRHMAATTEDGLRMHLAPGLADKDEDVVTAIIAHEFGHAVDFLYPARWITPHDGPGPATWVEDGPEARAWQKLWPRRGADHVEWAADGIAETVTGQRIGYCGPCVLQCFGGMDRPVGLR